LLQSLGADLRYRKLASARNSTSDTRRIRQPKRPSLIAEILAKHSLWSNAHLSRAADKNLRLTRRTRPAQEVEIQRNAAEGRRIRRKAPHLPDAALPKIHIEQDFRSHDHASC